MDKRRVLRHIPLLAGLPNRDLETISRVTRWRRYKRNEVIIRVGDRGNTLYLLTSGAVKVIINGPRGRQVVLTILYPYTFFGEMSLLDGCPRAAAVTALEESEVLTISRRTFLRLVRESPKIIPTMTATLSQRLRKTNQKVRELAFTPAFRRIAQVILELAKERGISTDGQISVVIPMTRREVGNLAGVSRETATKKLTELHRAGILMIQKRRLSILNLPELRRIAFL